MSDRKAATAAAIEDEHRGIKREVASLKSLLIQDVAVEEYAEWRLALLWRLRDFNNRLLKHFDLEEEGGFMNDVLEISPQAAHTVEQLGREHINMTGSLQKIISNLKSGREQDAEITSALRENMKGFFELLAKHEADEHQLIQRAYYREYGGPS